MFLDERHGVVFLFPGRSEAALPVLREDELVAPYALALAVQPDVGGEAQAEAAVLSVSCVEQHLPDVELLRHIVVFRVFLFHRCFRLLWVAPVVTYAGTPAVPLRALPL